MILAIVFAAYLVSSPGQSVMDERTIIKRYPDVTTYLKVAKRLQTGFLFPYYQCIESDVELPITLRHSPLRVIIERHQ